MHFANVRPLVGAAILLGAALGAATAQAATVTLSFGNSPGNYSPYQEAGYNVSANADGSGAVSLDNSNGTCPYSDPACLHISGSNPGSAFVERQDGQHFDALSFAISFAGNGNTNYVLIDNGNSTVKLALGSSYTGGVYTSSNKSTLVTGVIQKQKDYFIDLGGFAVAAGAASDFFLGIPELSVETAGGAANVRVDNITLSAVPIPAAGLLLLGGLGGLVAFRKRRPV